MTSRTIEKLLRVGFEVGCCVVRENEAEEQSTLITSVVKRQCNVMGMVGTIPERLNYHKASAYQHVLR